MGDDNRGEISQTLNLGPCHGCVVYCYCSWREIGELRGLLTGSKHIQLQVSMWQLQAAVAADYCFHTVSVCNVAYLQSQQIEGSSENGSMFTHQLNWKGPYLSDCRFHSAVRRDTKPEQLQRLVAALSCWSVSVWACPDQKCAHSIAVWAAQRHSWLQSLLIRATWRSQCTLPSISGLRPTPSGHKFTAAAETANPSSEGLQCPH